MAGAPDALEPPENGGAGLKLYTVIDTSTGVD